MTIKDIIGPSPWQLLRDYLQMLLGTVIYTIGYACFLLPYKIVSGGVTGISTIIFYLTGFHAGNTYFIINVFLLLLAMRILGWRYLVRTIIVTSLISVAIGLMQTLLTETAPDGTATLIHILGEQKFMACVIGAFLEGLGLATIFLAGGSTGGTDIIASSINKYWNISLGRLLLMLDIVIIGFSYIIGHDIETVVVGYLAMFISTNFLDYVINSARQSVQFIIISEHYEEIAEEVNTRLERGVTVLSGEGFYSKEKRQVLLILAKRYESRSIFQLIKRLDPQAFVSMSNVEGVFGEGFDVIKR
ncbi:MAG: YitT family protein [Bacteroidaceae bacterium]|nr:YitT family protein [Bacteroidaceae bacterium]MBQ8455180.1 YitT family protein [Bacteroidaceae bacterium]MBQ9169719.1 YitT family protein [Bacteroidaceae bacterium]MBQ9295348.1 YitT family protein [Bacteroidaceae bacterium]